jgi:predicted enzyme related to lactoylglutathione lyase
MSSPFVWFHHNGQKSKETKKFLESLLEWKGSEGPGGLTMLTADGFTTRGAMRGSTRTAIR